MFSILGPGGIAARRILLDHLLSNQLNDVEELRFSLRALFQRRLDECENEIVPETNKNENFIHEKYIKYSLYPLYIDWKKIEGNESEFYMTLAHFGYFGAHIYSTFKSLYPGLKTKNIINVFSLFTKEFLENPKNKTEEMAKEAEKFMALLPELKTMFSLIKNKVIMYKEVPMYLMIFKIYEIYYIFTNEKKKIIDLLKNEYLLISYITEEEYKEIYEEHFQGKVSQVFSEIVKKFDKMYEIPKSKNGFINHLKIIFQDVKKRNENNEI